MVSEGIESVNDLLIGIGRNRLGTLIASLKKT
jgi:hypothetical protein